ncbi:MAG: Hsp20/alpha crystallin family protein [Chloroflexi bacterium]|nr:Hsp20/alpha crystallin family protein [Chloroflexota bacterium]
MDALTIWDQESDMMFLDPFYGTSSLIDEVEVFMDSFRDSWIADLNVNLPLVTEVDKEVMVKLEMPGVKRTDLDISLEGNVLTIKTKEKNGKQKKDSEDKGVTEYFYSVNLPAPVDGEKVIATFKNGLLQMKFPKIVVESRKIEITRKATKVDKKEK